MAYQFRYTYTLEDLTVLARVAMAAYRKWRVRIYRIIVAVLSAVYLFAGIAILRSGRRKGAGIVAVAVGVFLGAIALFYYQFTAHRSRRLLVEQAGEITVTLEEGGVRGVHQKGEEFHPYSAVIGIFRSKGRFFLFIDKKHAIILPEEKLTAGDPALLNFWLRQKLGQEIREL